MYDEDLSERLLQDIFSLPQILLKSLNVTKFEPQVWGKISSSKCDFARKTTSSAPFNKKKL